MLLTTLLFLQSLSPTPNNANVLTEQPSPVSHDWTVIFFYVFIAVLVGALVWFFVHGRKTSTKNINQG